MVQFLAWLPKEEITAVSWSMTDRLQFVKEFQAKGWSYPEMDGLFEGWVDCQETFTKKVRACRSYSLAEALIAADVESEGRAHDGLADAYNTALLFAKMETEEELVLNPYYAVACREEKEDTLSVSLGELFQGLDFQVALA